MLSIELGTSSQAATMLYENGFSLLARKQSPVEPLFSSCPDTCDLTVLISTEITSGSCRSRSLLSRRTSPPRSGMGGTPYLAWQEQRSQPDLRGEILPFITSTRVIPKPWTDITLDGTVSSPWRLYALANADDPEKVKEAMTSRCVGFRRARCFD